MKQKIYYLIVLFTTACCSHSKIKSVCDEACQVEQKRYQAKVEETSVDANDIANLIQTEGARQTISILWQNSKRWDAFIRKVETGDERYLKLATTLKEVSDPATALDLNIGMALAIAKNPEGVLSKVDESQISDVCMIPYMYPSPSELEAFVQESVDALRTVKDKKVLNIAKLCIKKIEG